MLLSVDVVPSSAVYKPFIVIELSTHIPGDWFYFNRGAEKEGQFF